jgi:hypothetical protein
VKSSAGSFYSSDNPAHSIPYGFSCLIITALAVVDNQKEINGEGFRIEAKIRLTAWICLGYLWHIEERQIEVPDSVRGGFTSQLKRLEWAMLTV